MHSRLVPLSYDDWKTDPDYGMTNAEVRQREAERESDEAHADCLDDMLFGIAAVAAENLKAYNLGILDKDVVDWLEGVRDHLMDNLLWQEWGNASDLIPRDSRAHCEQAWGKALEGVE